MRVAIHSIQSTLFDGEAEKLICWTPNGQITILDNHLPIITTLIGPEVKIVDRQNREKEVRLKGGFLEVRPESEIVILANSN